MFNVSRTNFCPSVNLYHRTSCEYIPGDYASGSKEGIMVLELQ